jgi:hypothetical protein
MRCLFLMAALVAQLSVQNAYGDSFWNQLFDSKDGLFDRARGRIVGSEQYLTKPFTKDELLGAISNQIA